MLPAHGPYDGLSVKTGWTKPTTGNQSAFVQLLHSTRPHSESGAYVYQIRLLFVPLWDDQVQPFSCMLCGHYTTRMQVLETPLRDVKLIQPQRFGDSRGWFAEVFNQSTFAAAGLSAHFVQDNQSFSVKGVLRGLHYQLGKPQGKLVRVLSGHIWDVAVDLRRESPDFGKWAGFYLKAESSPDHLELLWIPEGFAHGFLVLSDTAEVLYKTTNIYYPQGERSILWNDPTLAIDWPLEALNGIPPSVSPKDASGRHFLEAELPPVEVSHLV
jgi:dTDP-4-dehydrorhamnose 3,5-epimerase